MATIIVRDIPEPLYKSIKQSAVKNRRSTNSEIIHLLELASSSAIPTSITSPKEKLEAIRKVRAAIGNKTIRSAAEITAAKREGRSQLPSIALFQTLAFGFKFRAYQFSSSNYLVVIELAI